MCKEAFSAVVFLRIAYKSLIKLQILTKTENNWFVFKLICCFTDDFSLISNYLCRRHNKTTKCLKPTKPYVMLLHGFSAICSLGMSNAVFFFETL